MAADEKLVILKRANKYFRQGKIETAIKEYKKILDIKPNDLEIRRIVGDLERKQNNINEASEQYEWIADYYLREGFFTKAIAMYKMITRIDPNSKKALFQLAELYSKQGLVVEAKQIYLDIAEECKRQNNQKKALDMYKKILEFDRTNTKMRLLLADNYLKEGLTEDATGEYLIAADILIKKKDYKQVEDILKGVIPKLNNPKIVQRLVSCYMVQGEEDKAISFFRELGQAVFQSVDLLKIYGELYFKKRMMNEAEDVFKKIVQLDPNETEVIMKLGKVYLQRSEFDRAYELFLPIVEKNIEEKKYEEAASFLRFIIASNNSYFPALNKLAAIFKASGKKSNLIALYESLIPVYEQRGMIEELKAILEELIELSDSPFTYEDQLSKLTGKKLEKEKEKEDEKKEREFISFNLKTADEALQAKDFDKAVEVLKKSKGAFSKNVEIRVKLFDVYQLANDVEAAIEEGKDLLKLYKFLGIEDEYSALLDKLSNLKPSDEKLIELSGLESTNIDIDFSNEDIVEQFNELSDPSAEVVKLGKEMGKSDELLVLSEEQSVTDAPSYQTEKISKSLSSYLSEIDFYINDGYFGDAEKLIESLRDKYPESEELLHRLKKLEKVKLTGPGRKKEDDASPAEKEPEIQPPPSVGPEEDDIEIDLSSFAESGSGDVEIEASIADESQMAQEFSDSKVGMKVGVESPPEEIKVDDIDIAAVDEPLQVEMDESPDEAIFVPQEDEAEAVVETPAIEPKVEVKQTGFSTSGDMINLDKIMMGEDSSSSDQNTPFKEADPQEMPFDEDEALLEGDDVLFPGDESYFETENNVQEELEAIRFWLKELERQRTSTTERNMMEIFDEFKKGVEEKIGKEDFDTRYNLGIAYKEMGLIEEAIHEFLISSKHEAKFFDSAGLLGMCFREKGMYDEAIGWFEKGVDAPGRETEEYLALKYEMIITFKLKEDFESAVSVAEEILKTNGTYRDTEKLLEELKSRP